MAKRTKKAENLFCEEELSTSDGNFDCRLYDTDDNKVVFRFRGVDYDENTWVSGGYYVDDFTRHVGDLYTDYGAGIKISGDTVRDMRIWISDKMHEYGRATYAKKKQALHLTLEDFDQGYDEDSWQSEMSGGAIYELDDGSYIYLDGNGWEYSDAKDELIDYYTSAPGEDIEDVLDNLNGYLNKSAKKKIAQEELFDGLNLTYFGYEILQQVIEDTKNLIVEEANKRGEEATEEEIKNTLSDVLDDYFETVLASDFVEVDDKDLIKEMMMENIDISDIAKGIEYSFDKESKKKEASILERRIRLESGNNDFGERVEVYVSFGLFGSAIFEITVDGQDFHTIYDDASEADAIFEEIMENGAEATREKHRGAKRKTAFEPGKVEKYKVVDEDSGEEALAVIFEKAVGYKFEVFVEGEERPIDWSDYYQNTKDEAIQDMVARGWKVMAKRKMAFEQLGFDNGLMLWLDEQFEDNGVSVWLSCVTPDGMRKDAPNRSGAYNNTWALVNHIIIEVQELGWVSDWKPSDYDLLKLEDACDELFEKYNNRTSKRAKRNKKADYIDPNGWTVIEFGEFPDSWEINVQETPEDQPEHRNQGMYYGFIVTPQTALNKYYYGDTAEEVIEKAMADMPQDVLDRRASVVEKNAEATFVEDGDGHWTGPVDYEIGAPAVYEISENNGEFYWFVENEGKTNDGWADSFDEAKSEVEKYASCKIDKMAGKREEKLIADGYKFHSYEYDGSAQSEQRSIEGKGFETKLLRERTDTQGLKMFSVWVKGTPEELDGAGVSYLNW